MAPPRVPAVCEQCGVDFQARVDALRAGKGRFCTPACWRQSITRRPATASCEACGTTFEPKWQKHGLSRFCSTTCANRRRQVAVRHCEHCGTAYQRASRPGRFCTRACSAAAQRKPAEHVCPECGTTWTDNRQQARFCSLACWTAVRRRQWAERAGLPEPPRGQPLRQTLTCERCEEPFSVVPNRARERRFCSRSCANHQDRRQNITCIICGTTVQVFQSRIDRGPVRYCSRAHRTIGSRGPLVETTCAQCGKHGSQPARQAADSKRWFCSTACYQRAIAPRTRRCRACGVSFRVYPWQARRAELHSGPTRRYCSVSCANRRRKVERAPLLGQRNRRIIALHLEGQKAPRILATLAGEHTDWSGIVPATVRQVLARECAHCQARRTPAEAA